MTEPGLLLDGLDLFRRGWPKVRERFSVDEGGCWVWQGATSAAGYGQARVDGKVEYVHRITASAKGDGLSPGLHVDHLCRNRRCLNPVHLELVTSAENTRRGAAGVLKETCGQGHPWVPENILTKGDGTRRCKLCHREWTRKWNEAKP